MRRAVMPNDAGWIGGAAASIPVHGGSQGAFVEELIQAILASAEDHSVGEKFMFETDKVPQGINFDQVVLTLVLDLPKYGIQCISVLRNCMPDGSIEVVIHLKKE